MHNPLADRLKEAFNNLLDRIGIWAVYTRSDRRFPCRLCYNLDTNDARANCGACFGTGYRVQLERWMGYYTHNLRRSSSIESSLSSIGWTLEEEPIFFTRPQQIPTLGDRIFIVEWDRRRDLVPSKGRPVRIAEVLQVVFVEPMIAGEVIYRASHCDVLGENTRDYERALLGTPINITRT
jgi:hypothetical protein